MVLYISVVCSFLAESYFNCTDVHFVYPLTSWFIVLWSSVWPILKKVPYVHENNVYYVPIIRSVLYIAIRSDWLILLLGPSMSLLMLCLIVLAIIETDMKSPTLIIQLSAIHFCLMYFEALSHVCIFVIVTAASWPWLGNQSIPAPVSRCPSPLTLTHSEEEKQVC